MSQPVIRLTPLKMEETYVLLQKVREVHAAHYEYQTSVTDDDIKRFIQIEYSRPGSEENITTRDVVRDFIGGLNILHQNTGMDPTSIFGEGEKIIEEAKSPIQNRFQRI
jgi:hypothetical protein